MNNANVPNPGLVVPGDGPRRDGAGLDGRRTPAAARGEPAVWLTGGALAVALAMIVLILGVIAWRGAATFWPRDIERVTLRPIGDAAEPAPSGAGQSFLGQPLERESYRPSDAERAEIEELFGSESAARSAGVLDGEGRAERVRFFVGGRDLAQEPTRWVPLWRVAERTEADAGTALLERSAWGRFIGVIEGSVVIDDTPGGLPGAGDASDWEAAVDPDPRTFEERLAQARSLADEADRLLRDRLPGLEAGLARLDRRVRAAERAREKTDAVRDGQAAGPWPGWAWGTCLGLSLASVGLIASPAGRRRGVRPVLWVLLLISGTAVALEHPWSGPRTTAEDVAAITTAAEQRRAELLADKARVEAEVNRLRERADRFRAVVRAPGTGTVGGVEAASEPVGRIAPFAREVPGEPLRMVQIERIVRPNRLSPGDKVGVYLARWWSFLSERPGEAPGDGGVFPVIVGTVTLTLLLTVGVVPLGVIAAIYLREYAPQGVVTSTIRIAINNLAGVPSIVYGMFGLGFFCYTVGDWIDAGPAEPLGRTAWWPLLATFGVLVLLALLLGGLSRRKAGSRSTWERVGKYGIGLVWLLAVALAAWLIAETPYFGGFFSAKLPEQPTFGSKGILWASLTLAILTLPVVIVATEEAIAAVPNSMRQGSYGCGASRWQTVWRIVLPGAMPGVMTGTILAMARGAGEVAPLLLVGAVNLTKDLPVSGEWPFLHGDRSFMHLGFHIYNLGFQSPDSDATEPLVWTTTLLLISIVLVLNLIAVIIRARLRNRGSGAAV